ncbi:mechanosensitive ion channel family protein [Mangrovibacterium marinum]|uniref:Mechanosensing system component YbdG n=1 Tax=Mangrovibacterium marinum TaxID=1639118 RepID=A0A2T5C0K7_9BACT|nr:mechanosensitive ion channel domain-containing protein [Mangrovibacterium marinum]PTN08121.1 miniconductance mechanosensitive channel [Mangrovibacterium marinum]
MKQLNNWLIALFENLNISTQWATAFGTTISVIILIISALLAQLLVRAILLSFINKIFQKTKTEWDDFLIKRKVLSALAHLPSAFMIYAVSGFSELIVVDYSLSVISRIYFVFIFTMVAVRFANAVNDIYQTTPYAATRPIKGYVQLLQIFTIFVAVIFGIAILINKSPLGLFAGLGAMAAVLLLIFKDSILGFVASIQLSANKMLKPGDWIEMPSHKADGTVIDISLTTVKVQNWDKTITTIPTYALVSESFNNWAGMEESGGRRIKRSINLDMKSVRFADEKLLEKLSRFYLLKDYIADKQEDIKQFNAKLNVQDGDVYNGRRQTNLGIFRYYLNAYLKQNPNIHREMTFLVRHLQPTDSGLPIEIYVFSKDQRWANYEGIQADIFDHVLAILPEFDLRVYQSPSGYDITQLANCFKATN